MKSKDKEIKANHVKTWKTSGLSMREYCRKHGISYWSFREWKKIKQPGNKTKSGLIKIPPEIYINPDDHNPIEIIINSRICLSVKENFSSELLKNIINTLEELS